MADIDLTSMPRRRTTPTPEPKAPSRKRRDRAVLVPLAALSLLFAVEWLFSLRWRMVHDTPLNHYVAFLWEQYGMIPYRDIFETQMPGTFFFPRAVGAVFGYGDVGIRVMNVAWLAGTLASIGLLLHRFGRNVAWAGVVLCGLSYFQDGPEMTLQKDYLGILLVVTAMLVATTRSRWPAGTRALIAGLLFGLAAAIKPHLSIGLPFVLLFLAVEDQGGETDRSWKEVARGAWPLVVLGGAGWLVPVAGFGLWLWWSGAWPRFYEMLTAYLPWYLSMTETHETASGWARLGYLARAFQRLGYQGLWLLPGGFALYRVVCDRGLSSATKLRVYLLAWLTLAYGIYPVLAGQFYGYHWMPFQFLAICLAALALMEPADAGSTASTDRRFRLASLALATLLSLHLPYDFFLQANGYPPRLPKGGRADEIGRFLETRLAPGDTVQPFDWTGGSIHGMLLARARLATRFLYDYQFYHHVSRPPIQKLRREFVREFVARRPRFVIRVQTNRAWPWGEDTSTQFPEIQRILERDYRVAFRGDGYRILEWSRAPRGDARPDG